MEMILSSRICLGISGDSFGGHKWVGQLRASGAYRPGMLLTSPTVHMGTPTTRKYLAQNVTKTQVAKPWSREKGEPPWLSIWPRFPAGAGQTAAGEG